MTECPPGLPPGQWMDWRWQWRHRARDEATLRKLLPGLRLTADDRRALLHYPPAVTPYYASLAAGHRSKDPILRMAVPRAAELLDPEWLDADALDEEGHSPVPGLVRRYHDRAVLLTTARCAVHCRHCTRKRRFKTAARTAVPPLKPVCVYLQAHPEIRELIVSGGDPLMLATPVLARILRTLRAVPSIEILRIGSRALVTLPMRVDRELVNLLRRMQPLYLMTHFNHPVELTPAADAACRLLADAGVPMANQTVLLRGVNDDEQVLEDLFRGLLRRRVRPYYLLQCDLVRGVEAFRTPLHQGMDIMQTLRSRLSGLAVPSFVADMPGTAGKVDLSAVRWICSDGRTTLLRVPGIGFISYPEPGRRAPKRARTGAAGGKPASRAARGRRGA